MTFDVTSDAMLLYRLPMTTRTITFFGRRKTYPLTKNIGCSIIDPPEWMIGSRILNVSKNLQSKVVRCSHFLPPQDLPGFAAVNPIQSYDTLVRYTFQQGNMTKPPKKKRKTFSHSGKKDPPKNNKRIWKTAKITVFVGDS